MTFSCFHILVTYCCGTKLKSLMSGKKWRWSMQAHKENLNLQKFTALRSQQNTPPNLQMPSLFTLFLDFFPPTRLP